MFGRKRRRFGRRRSSLISGERILFFIDLLIGIITIVASAALVLAYFAAHVSPVKSWIVAFAGLAAPILYVVNGFLILYWIIRWKRFVLLPLLVFLLGFNNLSLFFKPTISKEIDKEGIHAPLVVLSYNVMGFSYRTNKDRKVSENLSDIVDFINDESADIVCIQEFRASTESAKAKIDSMINMPYNVVHYSLKNKNYGGWGVAIYSEYPIIDWGVVDFPDSPNSSIWADIVLDVDTVRIFNNHLQTTSVNSSEQEYISSHEYLGDADRDEKVRGIASKLKRNFKIRATQADTLSMMINECRYESIACGDFNDTPLSYVYTKLLGDKLVDPFRKKGHGLISNTYRGLFNMFRIDYILHSKEFETIYYASPSLQLSDHNPVIVGIDPRGRPN